MRRLHESLLIPTGPERGRFTWVAEAWRLTSPHFRRGPGCGRGFSAQRGGLFPSPAVEPNWLPSQMPPRKWEFEGREGASNSNGTASSPLASGVYPPRVRQNSFQPRTSLPGLFPPPWMPPLLCRVHFTSFIFFNCGEIHKTKTHHFKVKYLVASGTRTVPCDQHLNRLPIHLHQP